MPKHTICASLSFPDFTSTETTPSVIPVDAAQPQPAGNKQDEQSLCQLEELRVLLQKYSEEPWGVQAMPGSSQETSCRFLKGPREQMEPQLKWTLSF